MELCAPSSVTNYACTVPKDANGQPVSIPTCTAAIGTLNYLVGTSSVAEINSETNQITAEQPGTTVITATLPGSGSSAGYFSTCPPKSIAVTLNGSNSGTATLGVAQNLTTKVIDTNNVTITGLTLDYQSTAPVNISAGSSGGITANFPGQASVFAVCQPPSCNAAPINVVGLNGTGLPVSSNPVNITTPGTASNYVWFAAPGQSQYFVPVELLSGTVGSTVRMPYVPNSMVMDRLSEQSLLRLILRFDDLQRLAQHQHPQQAYGHDGSGRSAGGFARQLDGAHQRQGTAGFLHLLHLGEFDDDLWRCGQRRSLDSRLEDALYHRQRLSGRRAYRHTLCL